MNNRAYFTGILAVAFFLSCSNGKENNDDEISFFPVLSFLKSQVTEVDTSLYKIIKIEKRGTQSDTAFLQREQFKTYAKDFLSIPDISAKKLRGNYTEDRLYDDAMKRVVLTYTPKEKDAVLLRQEVTIEPVQGGDQVKTIFIDQRIETDDSTVEKKMLWRVNKRFQIVTNVLRPNRPEENRFLEIIWNDHTAAE